MSHELDGMDDDLLRKLREHLPTLAPNATPKELAQVAWDLQQKLGELSNASLSPVDLEILLFAAFYASLTVDEGRPVRFRMSVTDRVALMGLHSPLDVSVAALRKLAMTSSVSSFRAIAVAKLDDAMKIIGFDDAELGTRGNAIDWAHGHSRWSLTIEAAGPGCLNLYLPHFGAGLQLRDGRIRFLQLMSHIEPVRAFYEAAGETIHFEHRTLRARLVRYFWTRIIATVVKRRHGGCFIVYPPKPSVMSVGAIQYRIEKPECLLLVLSVYFNEELAAMKAVLKADEEFESVPLSRIDVDRMCDFIASLAEVDGAVLLQRDLFFVGFGTELRVSPERTAGVDVIEHGHDPYHSSDIRLAKLDKFGMRHRSAAGVCLEERDALAFVVSQDGDVSVFASDEAGLHRYSTSV